MKKSKAWEQIDNEDGKGLFLPGRYYAGFGVVWLYEGKKKAHKADIKSVFDSSGPDNFGYTFMFATDQFYLYTGKAKTPKAIYASMKRAKIFE